MADEIIELITKLPPYLCYIYPGYISMFLFYFFMDLTLEDTKAKTIKSIVISYMYIIVLQEGIIPTLNKNPCVKISTNLDSIDFNIIIIFISILIPYLIYICLYKRNTLAKILQVISINTTLDKNEVTMLLREYNDVVWMHVYLKNNNIMYAGYLKSYELGNNCTNFFCLSDYHKYLIQENGEEKKLKDNSGDDKKKVLIYYEQISHFEVANKQ